MGIFKFLLQLRTLNESQRGITLSSPAAMVLPVGVSPSAFVAFRHDVHVTDEKQACHGRSHVRRSAGQSAGQQVSRSFPEPCGCGSVRSFRASRRGSLPSRTAAVLLVVSRAFSSGCLLLCRPASPLFVGAPSGLPLAPSGVASLLLHCFDLIKFHPEFY